MPVSHLGLVVESPIAAAAFYSAALSPLGYRYFGARDDQLGFGVDDADFFLSPVKSKSRPAPIHVAFAAPSTLAVRKSYVAAVGAGGRPTGPPDYRGPDHQVFNAAVIDPDGNTVEIIYREDAGTLPHPTAAVEDPTIGSGPLSKANAAQTNAQSIAGHKESNPSTAIARREVRHRRTNSASVCIPSKSPPRHDSSRKHSPAPSKPQSAKHIVNTLLGAAAGAVAVCAAILTDSEDSRRGSHSDDSNSRRGTRSSKSKTDYTSHDSRETRARRSLTFPVYTGSQTHREHSSRHYEEDEGKRRDSGFSLSSRKLVTSDRSPMFRDTSNDSKPKDWTSEVTDLVVGGTSHRHTESAGFLNRPSQAQSYRRTSVPHIDTRASYRDSDRFLRDSFARQGRRNTAPAPVPMEMIERYIGSKTTRDSRQARDRDTVLPEDSISCVDSGRGSSRMDRRPDNSRRRSSRNLY